MSEPVVLPDSAQWNIPATGDLADLRIRVAHPAGPHQGPTRSLLLLDGDFLFLTAVEFARTVNLVTMGDFPPLVIIGVMRDEPDPMRYISSRFRDFTPQPWTLTGPFADDNGMASMGTGGASTLLASLEHAVLPQVADHLATVGLELGEVAIGGWSLSGLFASWAWLERPDLFAHLLAISPSLWWHDASLLTTDFASRPSGHKAFVCAGEHEEGDVTRVYPQRFANVAQREMAAMVGNALRFGELASGTGADIRAVSFADEHHITVQAAAIARGLLHLYA